MQDINRRVVIQIFQRLLACEIATFMPLQRFGKIDGFQEGAEVDPEIAALIVDAAVSLSW